MDTMLVIWFVVCVGMVVAELLTLGLTSIWFAGGAIVAFLANVAGASAMLQTVLFFAVSVFLIAVTRPIAKNSFNRNRVKTNAESLIGKTAVVTQGIDNLAGKGQVTVNGTCWSARSETDKIRIPSKTCVEITGIQGVKLIVKEKEEN